MAKSSKQKEHILKKLRYFMLPTLLSFILFMLIITAYEQIIADKYFPFTFVGDTNISFLTKGQALKLISGRFDQKIDQKLNFIFAQKSFTLDLATSSAKLDYSALDLGFNFGRGTDTWDRVQKQIQTLIFTHNIYPKISLSLETQTDAIASQINKPYQDAKLSFDETTTPEGSPSARIQIQDGVNGLILDKESLEKSIAQFLLTGKYKNVLPLKVVEPKVTTEHVLKARQALENTLNTPVKLVFEDQNWVIDAKQLLTILDLTLGSDMLLDKNKTQIYLAGIGQKIDQQVQEGLFEFNPDTKRVTSFKPSQEGRKLDTDKTYLMLNDWLTSGNTKTIDLPVSKVSPKIQTSDVNSLGIKELIGRGISNFAGSISNRIYNVSLTASKLNGVLVPPNEVFSFNQTVGDITAATGFKQAYVIKEGRTVLDDGGGVCQDSTTLFRAVLNAGLPVVARTAHAYRVGYYEQGFPPGLDATVFYPSVDFKFKNDTGNYILIQAYTAGLTLYIDLYGTSDGRTSSLTKSVVSDQTPPPSDLRQDDPTLPKGTIKQVDFSAWGANVSFKRTVTRGEETLANETWRSSYKPWQAIYLIGTQ